MTFKRTTPITALDLDSSDLPDAGPSSKGAVTLGGDRIALRRGMRLADAQQTVMAAPPTVAFSVTSGNSPIAAGASAVTLPYNTTRVSYPGCVPSDNAGLGLRDNGLNAGGTPSGFSVEFDYYGSDFVYRFRAYDTQGGNYLIYVDGQLTTATPFAPSGVSVSIGGVYRMRVTFATAAVRRIRIHMHSAQFQGLEIGPTDSVKAAPAAPLRVAVYGDSFVQSALNIPQQQAMPEVLGRYLGASIYNCGQGGTAYTHTGGVGGNAAYTDATRIAQCAAAAPHYVVVFGTVNQDGDATGVQAAAASVFSQFATALPNTKLFVVGPPPQHTSIPANRTSTKTQVRTAALAAPNVLGWIDPIGGTWESGSRSGGDGQQWITGTGWSTGTTGDGNADVLIGSDNAHPTVAGHEYLGSQIAAAILDILGGA
jgi:hypothetical protein